MRFEFGEYALDDVEKSLTRGGVPIVIERRAYILLHYLIRNRDRTVPKEELFRALWGGNSISESSLPRCMNALRSALGGRNAGRRRGEDTFIETVYGCGYRFVAPTRELAGEAASESDVASVRVARADRIAILKAGLRAATRRPSDDLDRLIELAELQMRQGLFEEARANRLRAAGVARACGDGERFGRLVVAMANAPLFIRRAERMSPFLSEAVDNITPGLSALALEIATEVTVSTIGHTAAVDRAADVRRTLSSGPDRVACETWARVLGRSRQAIEGPGTHDERRDLAARSLDAAQQLGDPTLEAAAQSGCLAERLAAGDLLQFDLHRRRLRALAEQLQENQWLARSEFADSVLAFIRGRSGRSIEHRDRALDLIRDSPDDHALATGAHCIMMTREHLGQIHRIMPAVGVDLANDPAPGIAMTVGLLHHGLRDRARRIFDEFADRWFDSLAEDLTWTVAMALYAEAAFLLDEPSAARRAYGALLRTHDVMASMDSVVCLEPVDFFRGLAATTLERWDDADRHFATAVKRCEEIGARGFEVRITEAWAQAIARRSALGVLACRMPDLSPDALATDAPDLLDESA